MNRGWTFNAARRRVVTIILQLVYGVARVFGRSRSLASIRRGASFITDLRVQWLSMLRHHRAETERIVVVQLLGTIDDVVSPEDDIDLSTGEAFYYVDVPNSGHQNIIHLDDRPFGHARKAALRLALTGDRENLKEKNAVPSSLPRQATDPNVQHVLFVIHGIRDFGFWTSHLARRVIHRAFSKRTDKLVIAALTPTYGYFAMLPFVLSSTRRGKVRWFMDQYVEALARFPNAQKFSYIGHSNGTYLLAGALSDYRCCHFHNVVFAGSVVSSGFDWRKQINAKRVSKVVNYVATADWVVAIFSRFLGRLVHDLGGAGFDGFRRSTSGVDGAVDVNDVKYLRGGHGTAVNEKNWDSIAKFIINDEIPKPELEDRVGLEAGERRRTPQAVPQSITVRTLAHLAPLIWLMALALILWPVALFLSLRSVCWVEESGSLSARCLVALLWFLLVRAVLTRT
jgi:hypothetical protein